MVVKQCHTRLKLFVLNHQGKKWREPSAFNRNRAGRSSATVSPVTAVNTSRSLQGFAAAARSGCEEEPRGQGGAAGRRISQVSAGAHMSVRELSTSVRTFQYDLKPEVPNSEGRKLFFDTHAVVRLFEDNGFTTQQAEVMVKVLVRMTNSNMDVIYNDMVTKVQQEIMLQRVMSQIASVKKDMIILEKSEFSTLLAENEKLKIQILQLKVGLSDVMNKVRSDTILDMHLEKSHVKELKSQHAKMLLEMRTEIMEMTADQDRHLTQTNMKIDTEAAGLKTMLESHKLDTIKYLAGSVFTCLTVVLGFYRVWM
ncbi:mitochondrial calcium uniporter regulator 1 [Hippoglossus stenolepis]|uniref:mitochondrial calcium uniporter regulator 1 n=1 Tax=Hippoglossus stenolepis TaxID=195615 RepID=UPI001FAFD455|nr:mitochondrial calcium uniporter regulator 1 [Hippoglossus stenolepis]